MLATDSESELAGVMAHEIAHVTQHHIARMIRAQSQQSITTAAAHARGHPARARGGGGQAIEGGIAAAQGMAVQQQINFTRDNECGGRPRRHRLPGRRRLRSQRAWARFLRDHRAGTKGSRPPTSRRCCIDHPVTTDRIAEARARAAQFPPRKRQRLAELRAGPRAGAGPDRDRGRRHRAASTPTSSRTARTRLGNRYGEALALMDGQPRRGSGQDPRPSWCRSTRA